MIISRGSPISGGRGLIAWGKKRGREDIEVWRRERRERREEWKGWKSEGVDQLTHQK